jgi:hypothetical protein
MKHIAFHAFFKEKARHLMSNDPTFIGNTVSAIMQLSRYILRLSLNGHEIELTVAVENEQEASKLKESFERLVRDRDAFYETVAAAPS